MDALQLFVCGFETQALGSELVIELENLGFYLKCQYDGTQDSNGGIIETGITAVDELATEDLEDILESLNRIAGHMPLSIQYRSFECVDECCH